MKISACFEFVASRCKNEVLQDRVKLWFKVAAWRRVLKRGGWGILLFKRAVTQYDCVCSCNTLRVCMRKPHLTQGSMALVIK